MTPDVPAAPPRPPSGGDPARRPRSPTRGLPRATAAALAAFAATSSAAHAQDAGAGSPTVKSYLDLLALDSYISEGSAELFATMALLVPVAFAMVIGWKIVKGMGRV